MDLFCVVLLLLAPLTTAKDNLLPAPNRGASEYRLRYRDPSDCDPDHCDYFVGIDTNSDNASFLDIYIVGNTDGWVALGLTKSATMFEADVLGCITDSTNQTSPPLAVDTYNPDSRTNTLDPSEQETNGHPIDVITHSRELVNGHIKCIFSRLIKGVDPSPKDLFLDEKLFLLFGRGSHGRESSNISGMTYHDIAIPTISEKKYNPASDSGDIGISTLKYILTVAHGALMLVAWPLLSFIAIFFAAWMKPALPNGEWFQVHRAFNVASLLIAVVAFILIFVANKDQTPSGLIDLGATNKIGTTHFILGILIVALQFVNPIISLFRCKPNDKYRWIFILTHGIIVGYGVQAFAYINIGLGITMYSQTLTEYGDLTLLWVYLGAAIFSILLGCILFLIFSGEGFIFKTDAQSISPTLVKIFLLCCHGDYSELTTTEAVNTPATNTESNDFTPFSSPSSVSSNAKAPPSRDAPIRWLSLIAFFIVMTSTVITLIVLMIIKRNW